jgi:hypothetical protein
MEGRGQRRFKYNRNGKQAGNGLRSLRTEEDCIGRQGTQQTVAFEKKKKSQTVISNCLRYISHTATL